MFPFGVKPEACDSDKDGRGPDTVDRLLLHGARYHEREAVFLCWKEGGGKAGWEKIPDWRVDRHAIRVGLALRQSFGLSTGELVALWLPLDQQLALVERGLWALEAISVPIWLEWSPEQIAEVLRDARPKVLFAPDRQSVDELHRIGGLPETLRATILLRGPAGENSGFLTFAELMDLGGALDTPEKAGMWRNSARSVLPEAIRSVEYSVDSGRISSAELSNRDLMGTIEAVLERFPAHLGGIRLMASNRPDPLSRAIVYAGWADGLTQTAFARSRAALERVGELGAELVVGPEKTVTHLPGALEVSPGSRELTPRRGILSRLGLGRREAAEDGRGARLPFVLVTDRSSTSSKGSAAHVVSYRAQDNTFCP